MWCSGVGFEWLLAFSLETCFLAGTSMEKSCNHDSGYLDAIVGPFLAGSAWKDKDFIFNSHCIFFILPRSLATTTSARRLGGNLLPGRPFVRELNGKASSLRIKLSSPSFLDIERGSCDGCAPI
jgi:hypothetical protein